MLNTRMEEEILPVCDLATKAKPQISMVAQERGTKEEKETYRAKEEERNHLNENKFQPRRS